MSILSIKVMHLENLQVTDIKGLNSSALTGKVKIKSKVKVKKGIKRNSMSYREL